MHAYELFTAVKPAIVNDMFMWMRETDRNLYKTALGSLATNRKLRLAFLQKKPATEQIAWMHKTLMLKSSDMIGEHLLQVYFMKGQEEMLATFCDGLEIPHDGNGQVEGELPETLDADKLKTAVDALLEKYDPALVALYLYTFNIQTPDGWEELSKTLAEDDRLKLA
ncbi:hypothetical protein JO972_01055 [Verrucomicrobiaceae bacterium 5K15]|uniref:Uncharacterized protein n=1 Tax=Oceaniferula flava TaxID=2800421 RepID=A0AAE2SA20_9BACT|nr:hypothetical protein [Oceaniferula flavus]MBK1853537.1 hypothetical protein [Oceaniferula flavus]MBM1134842.1 hypothetical protein [Oceaniferula flavus]